jgi:hypothetical protein
MMASLHKISSEDWRKSAQAKVRTSEVQLTTSIMVPPSTRRNLSPLLMPTMTYRAINRPANSTSSEDQRRARMKTTSTITMTISSFPSTRTTTIVRWCQSQRQLRAIQRASTQTSGQTYKNTSYDTVKYWIKFISFYLIIQGFYLCPNYLNLICYLL